MRFNYILIIFIFLLHGCGYQSIHSVGKSDISIIKFGTNGSDEVSKKLIKNFKKLQKNKEATKYYEVKANSTINKSINSKNKKGKAETYSLEVSIDLIVKKDDQIIQTKQFSEKTNYNSLDNKFELKQYENIIIQGQTNKIINRINAFLRSL